MGSPDDQRRAAELYATACDNGDPLGCAELGAFFEAGGGGLTRDMVEASLRYRTACDAGIAKACLRLGRLFEHGQGVARDLARALDYDERGCRGGEIDACLAVADMTWVTNPERAAEALERACGAGLGGACTRLADMVAAKDRARAAALRDRACTAKAPAQNCPVAPSRGTAEPGGCDGGDDAACTKIVTRYIETPPGARDPLAAASALRKGCDKGSVVACLALADLYDKGDGVVAKDTERATELYTRAIENCHAPEHRDACQGIAVAAKGTPERADAFRAAACSGGQEQACHDQADRTQSPENALSFHAHACQGGFGAACATAGAMYLAGKGASRDPRRAAELYGHGCEVGNVAACRGLASLVESGTGVARDPARALSLYQKACAGSMGEACFKCGALIEAGGDRQAALEYYDKACTLGFAPACQARSGSR